MCRSIRTLHGFEPPATDEELAAAALQFVRKLSGTARPSQANTEAFERAVAEVTAASRRMLDDLVRTGPAKDRDGEAAKARERSRRRFADAT